MRAIRPGAYPRFRPRAGALGAAGVGGLGFFEAEFHTKTLATPAIFLLTRLTPRNYFQSLSLVLCSALTASGSEKKRIKSCKQTISAKRDFSYHRESVAPKNCRDAPSSPTR